MVRKIIALCVKNRFLVLVLTGLVGAAGIGSMLTIPLDAIPDLSDVQVIIYSQWMGRDPETIEDQVTYPVTTKMLSVPGAKVVRGYSFFGFSLVYVIFEDGADLYWARSRVLEYLSDLQARLPPGVTSSLGPDATGVGWVYEYTLESGRYCPDHRDGLFRPAGKDGPYYEKPPSGIEVERIRAFRDLDRCPVDGQKLLPANLDLGEIRALQDWYLRYQLTAVEGVAEVASVGGYERQFQITVDPNRLLTYNLPLKKVIAAIRRSNNDVGGRLLELTETEYMIRGRGYVQTLEDLEQIVVGTSENGIPVLLRDVATCAIGPEIRRGLAEKNGEGQVVAGIIVMRFGENALKTIENVKRKIDELQRGLPPGLQIKTAYDRSALIHRSIHTLTRQLLEEMLIVALVCVVFLWHARSALVSAITLPLGILLSFLVMRALGINANIMSLGGIAIAIGAMVDAAVVLVENAHKRLHEQPGRNRLDVIIEASQEVGPALFFSLLIITVSFLPVFALTGQAGRLFKPLAYTKTFAMAASSLLAITLIPIGIALFVSRSVLPATLNRSARLAVVLSAGLGPPILGAAIAAAAGWTWFTAHQVPITLGWILLMALVFIPQRIRSEEENPVSRLLIGLYMPVIRWVLRHPWIVITAAAGILLATAIPYTRLGSEFMPPLNEGDILYMPTSIPGISVTAAQQTLQMQDKLFKTFPEVDVVLGKIGRAETPTDPAPLTMVETTVTLKPKESWPRRKLVEGQFTRWLIPLLDSLGDLPDTYVRTAAEEIEKMVLSEFNPAFRRAVLEGPASFRQAVKDAPKRIVQYILKEGPGIYRSQARAHLKDRTAASIARELDRKPLERIAAREVNGDLQMELGPLRGRLEELRPGSGGFAEEIQARISSAWRKTKDRTRFVEGLTRRVEKMIRESLPDHLIASGLIRPEVDAAAVRRHLSERLRPDDLLPLRFRRVRDIEELMYDEMDTVFQFPGLTNAWTMPIKTRIDMLATGIKTPIGIKIFGPDLKTLERLATQVEAVVKRDPGTLSAIAERVFGGNYLDFEIDRKACARHGLTVGDVQDIIETAVGGMNITQTVEGLYRFKVNVRYPREMRDDPVRLARVLVPTPLGEQIPIGQLARIKTKDGPPAIKTENGMREAIVYVDLKKGEDVGSYVARVRKIVDREVELPPGYYISWSGQFEYMQEVNRRLAVIVPITLVLVFLLLYFNFGRITETLVVMLSLPFAAVGGVWLMYLLDYNMSVAVWIGFIALAGLAAETGVVMLVYLDLAWDRRVREGKTSHRDLIEAVLEGAVLRVRPKMMTVTTTILGLLPILWATGAGARPMKRLAAPMIGGLVSSTILTLVVIPAVYYLIRKARRGGAASPEPASAEN